LAKGAAIIDLAWAILQASGIAPGRRQVIGLRQANMPCAAIAAQVGLTRTGCPTSAGASPSGARPGTGLRIGIVLADASYEMSAELCRRLSERQLLWTTGIPCTRKIYARRSNSADRVPATACQQGSFPLGAGAR
jgi:hypothetical protein